MHLDTTSFTYHSYTVLSLDHPVVFSSSHLLAGDLRWLLKRSIPVPIIQIASPAALHSGPAMKGNESGIRIAVDLMRWLRAIVGTGRGGEDGLFQILP